MNALQDKLRKILIEFDNTVSEPDKDFVKFKNAEAQLKQAFQDDPNWFNRGEVVLTEDVTDYIPIEPNTISDDSRTAYNQGLMWATEYMMKKQGQEFYDRFKAELDNSRWMKTGGDLLYGDVLEAARRAANIKEVT